MRHATQKRKKSSAITLHPKILRKEGKPQFVVLPYEEFLRMKEVLSRMPEGIPAPDKRYGGFWDNLSAEELARRQGVSVVREVSALYGEGDPVDWEGFDEALERWRTESWTV